MSEGLPDAPAPVSALPVSLAVGAEGWGLLGEGCGLTVPSLTPGMGEPLSPSP